MDFTAAGARVKQDEVLLERLCLRTDPALSIEGHAGAVEDQTVISTYVVDVNYRNLVLHRNGFQHFLAKRDLFCIERRRCDVEQYVGASLNGFLNRIARVELPFPEVLIVPGVLAHRHPEAVSSELINSGRRARFEVAGLVKDIVEGKQHLQVVKHSLAAIEEGCGVRDRLAPL